MVNPICGFLRLSKGVYMPDTMEVNIPIRFVFVFLVPIDSRQDPHGVGRAFGTLMANPVKIILMMIKLNCAEQNKLN